MFLFASCLLLIKHPSRIGYSLKMSQGGATIQRKDLKKPREVLLRTTKEKEKRQIVNNNYKKTWVLGSKIKFCTALYFILDFPFNYSLLYYFNKMNKTYHSLN